MLFFRGKQVPGADYPELPAAFVFCNFSALVQTAFFEPKGLKRPPKWSPKCNKMQKVLRKSAAKSGLEIRPEKRRSTT